jgi:CYTH domain-containing protein
MDRLKGVMLNSERSGLESRGILFKFAGHDKGRLVCAEASRAAKVCPQMGVAKLTDENVIVPESKYARIERERRYLLNDLPEGLARTDPHVQITDNYITGTRLRIRKVRDPKTNKWTVKFTQKFAPNPDDLSRTIITNIYLNALEAETLSVFEANEIRKNRYHFDFAGRRFSVDVFLGDLFGLVLAETSFESDEDMAAFQAPSFALADVTNNEVFSGGRLCKLTFGDVRNEVQRAGFVKTQTAN